MHELSIVQSSLFSQAITNAGVTGDGVGLGGGLSVGRGVGKSTIGGGNGEEGPTPGIIGCPGGKVEGPATGLWVIGTSVVTAVHFKVGLPDVPGGHKHEGRWSNV